MATFADMSVAQTDAIKQWTPEHIDTRMEMIGRAATFVDQIDRKQKDVMGQIELESGRMNERVMEINVLKATVENVAASTSSQFDLVIGNFKEFADAARAEISAGARANKEAMAKEEEVRTSVNELFEKTRFKKLATGGA